MTELKSGRGGPRGPELALVGKNSKLGKNDTNKKNLPLSTE